MDAKRTHASVPKMESSLSFKQHRLEFPKSTKSFLCSSCNTVTCYLSSPSTFSSTISSGHLLSVNSVSTAAGLPVTVSAVNACVSTGMSDDMKKLFTTKKGILNFPFPKSVISLPTNVNRNVICNILRHSVTALFQVKSNGIINGFELTGSLINHMSNIRVNIDKYHDEWYSETCKLAQKINVNESVPRTCARQTARENFPAESPSHYYKLSLSIPLIDTVLSELKRRFEGNQKCIFEGLYLIPYIMVGSLKNNISMSWKDHFKIFLKFYESDFEDLSFKSLDAELSLWEHHWENCSANLPDNVSATLKQISFPCFPFIKRALRILGTISVS